MDVFWSSVEKIFWVALVVAFSLYLTRLFVYQFEFTPNWIVAFESMSWILAILGLGSLYLNKPSRLLSYCSPAVYPIYIVHLPVQFIVAYFLLPLQIPASLKLILLLASTFGISLMFYEVLRRKIKWIGPLFGMKLKDGKTIAN